MRRSRSAKSAASSGASRTRKESPWTATASTLALAVSFPGILVASYLWSDVLFAVRKLRFSARPVVVPVLFPPQRDPRSVLVPKLLFHALPAERLLGPFLSRAPVERLVFGKVLQRAEVERIVFGKVL